MATFRSTSDVNKDARRVTPSPRPPLSAMPKSAYGEELTLPRGMLTVEHRYQPRGYNGRLDLEEKMARAAQRACSAAAGSR